MFSRYDNVMMMIMMMMLSSIFHPTHMTRTV